MVICCGLSARALSADLQVLHGLVPPVTKELTSVGRLDESKQLSLAIALPLRNRDGLSKFLKEVSDPTSPNFRHYLTPAQFTEKYGPTKEDYEAVIRFATAHGLAVTARHPNRLVLDVQGKVSDVESALHLTMRVYQHPTEQRQFYAPNADPTLDLQVAIQEIRGLDNFELPKPSCGLMQVPAQGNATANVGQGYEGSYAGSDFRAAYIPGSTLTGTGQNVALLEFDGYYSADIGNYETEFGLGSMSLVNVAVDGGVTTPGSGDLEVSLDIELAMAMAPGLSKIYVYEAPNSTAPWIDILNKIADDDLASQISCSWSGGLANPDSAANAIFEQMAAQGQSFFNASGDTDAYTNSMPFPVDSPQITIVGGTVLTTAAGNASYVSEAAWRNGASVGTGGGISPNYPIPTWQQGVSMASNGGSTMMRNIPDVAMVAYNVCVTFSNGYIGVAYGTSCGAPLWAGLTALVNQQALANGYSVVGFVNPAIYWIGTGSDYDSAFHDVQSGNNFDNSSPSEFSAVAGYDLCTGWGSPSGATLIDLLSEPTAVPSITSPLNASGTTELAFSYQIEVSNYANEYSASDLPSGLSCNTQTGLISGTPSEAGAFNVTLSASDQAGTATAELSLVIAALPYAYTVNSGDATITQYTGSGTVAVIPSIIDGYTVTSIGDSAFSNDQTLTGVTIPDTVNSIGNLAFYNCSDLASMTIPSGVVALGTCAFEYCWSLTNVTIPAALSSIPQYTFCNCGLTSATIPNGITTIGNYAFENCPHLTSVTIPSSVTSVGDYAFQQCDLTSLTIPSGVTSIGAFAFDTDQLTSLSIPASVTSLGDSPFSNNNLTSITVSASNPDFVVSSGVLFNKGKTELIQYPTGSSATSYSIPSTVKSIADDAFASADADLEEVTIPSGVTSIGNNAFQGCLGLNSVTIPSTVTSIGDVPFDFCGSLTSITVNSSNRDYSSSSGVLFNKNKTTLIEFPENSSDTSYSVPSTVTTVGDQAFEACLNLNTVSIPSSVTSIGSDAFDECWYLSNISIPSGVTSIADETFWGDLDILSITIPSGVTSIGENAFAGTGITSITIPDEVTTIGDYAFSYTGISTVTIPASVTSIGDYAFGYCGSLGTAYFQESAAPTMGQTVFQSPASGFTIYFPGGATGYSTPVWDGYPAYPQ